MENLNEQIKDMDMKMKCETVLTKDYSNMMKGVAVLLMIIHHTWGFPCRIPELHILHMEELIGIASKICIYIYVSQWIWIILYFQQEQFYSFSKEIKGYIRTLLESVLCICSVGILESVK